MIREGNSMGKVRLSPDELVTSTQAAAQLPHLLDGLDGGRWFTQRRNGIEAVLISLAEYERLMELEETLGHVMLAHLLREREQAQPEEYQNLD
jgi:hypothetical protein